MRLLAAHAAAVAVHPLVRDGRHHAGGLTDDAGQRADAGLAQVGDQLSHAKAAHLFVVAERKMDRKRRVAVKEGLRMGQRQGDETLHVGRAPAEQSVVAHRGRQRIDRPRLAVPGHGVGVARQDHTGRFSFTERGEQVGLGPVGIEGQPARHPERAQRVADVMDQFEVGVRAHGVHANQVFGECEGAVGNHGPILRENTETRAGQAKRPPLG